MCDLRFLHSDISHFAHRNKADTVYVAKASFPLCKRSRSGWECGKGGQLRHFQGAAQKAWWMFAFRAN